MLGIPNEKFWNYIWFEDRFMPRWFHLRFLLAFKSEHVLVLHYFIVKQCILNFSQTCNLRKKLSLIRVEDVWSMCCISTHLHNCLEVNLLLMLVICKSKNTQIYSNPGAAKLLCGFFCVFDVVMVICVFMYHDSMW